MKKIKLGTVGVDSGQLIITDPCYIDSIWNRESEFVDIRRYKDKEGNVFEYRVHFENYESEMPNGKTPNELIKSGEWVKAEVPEKEALKGEYSYAGCAETSIASQGGQLKYPKGHDGAGVVFRSGFGDGTYDVFAYVDNVEGWGERVCKVEIILIDEEKEEFVKPLLNEK